MRLKILLSLLFFLATAIMLQVNLEKPFWGEHDWNGAKYGNIARNYLRYGLFETKFGQVENSGFANFSEFEYLTHYPPLLPLLISLSYKFFGVLEWTTRLVPLLFTSGTMVLIFLIGSYLWGTRIGLIASSLVLVTPLVLYFGKNPVHEPLVVFFVLLAFFGYLRNSKLLFIFGLILALVSTWTGYFLVPAITVVALLRRDLSEVKRLIPYWGLSFASLLIYIAYTAWVTGFLFGGDLLGVLLQRMGISQAGQIEDLNFINYLQRIRLWLSTLYTLTLIGLVLIWLISKKAEGLDNRDWKVLTLGIFGIIYLMIFPNAAFVHNYLVFYLLPFFALSGALGIEFLQKKQAFKKLGVLLPAIFILVVALERRDFLQALQKSNADRLAYEVGMAIKQKTNPSDLVLVSPVRFQYSADKFLRFYGDRKLIYADKPLGNFDIWVKVNQTLGKFEIIKK